MEYGPRKMEKEIEKWLKRPEVLLLKGPRQSGKTTLLQHLKERFGGSYVTLEDEGLLATFESNPRGFAERYLADERTILFIDEAQYCRNAGKVLKLLHDLFSVRLKLVVSGSGSFDIKVEVGKYLVGRAVYFELLPLDFGEFLSWRAGDLHGTFIKNRNAVRDFILHGKDITLKPAFERELGALLEEYLTYGGFPAIVKESDGDVKKELLKNLARTYIEKDVFFFLNIRHIEKFRKLLAYLCAGTGSLLEVSTVTGEMKMDFKTAENYLSVMSGTCIVSLLPPFHKNLQTELRKSRKVYFYDTGLRNAVMDNFLPPANRTDRGALLENFVYNELRNFGGRINYWRTAGKAEVDFILDLGREPVPVEVKGTGGLPRGFLSFLKAYRPERGLVFTTGEFGIRKIEDTRVAFVPHFFI